MIAVASDDFRALRDRIRSRFGLYFDDSKESLLQSRLQARMVTCRAQTLGQYRAYLDEGPAGEAEWDELASLLSNNETYFLRERAQLGVLTGTVLDHCQRRGTALRIWSAACSTGEEPYSLAMSLLESGRIQPDECSILATDLSPRVLERARAGLYRELAFRATPPALIEKYFRPRENGFSIEEPVKSMVCFSRVNLLDPQATARVGLQDAIFCRNVLIYFDRATQLEVARRFATLLPPGGFLFLGHAESLMHATDLYHPVVTSETVYYRRTSHAAPH